MAFCRRKGKGPVNTFHAMRVVLIGQLISDLLSQLFSTSFRSCFIKFRNLRIGRPLRFRTRHFSGIRFSFIRITCSSHLSRDFLAISSCYARDHSLPNSFPKLFFSRDICNEISLMKNTISIFNFQLAHICSIQQNDTN